MSMNRSKSLRRGIGGALSVTLVASSLTLGAAAIAPAAFADHGTPVTPDFGPNVTVIDPTMTTQQINTLIAPVQGNPYRQILFKPGVYGSAAGQDDPSTATDLILASLNANTAIAGLGTSPKDTTINGALYVNGRGFGTLGTFARSLSNLSINPIQPGVAPHTLNWITSQTAPLRRVNVTGNLDIAGTGNLGFGSQIQNTRITGNVNAGNGRNTATAAGQPNQYLAFVRNSEIGGAWSGFSTTFVFSGTKGAPKADFGPETRRSASGDKITLDRSPDTREAPFLYLDKDRYKVFVPDARFNTRGVDWRVDRSSGRSLSLNDFFIAKTTNTAAEINAQLAKGKHLILTPGRYSLTESLRITRPNTVVLGLGFATIVPTAGTRAIEVGDVPGVILSSFSVNAGTVNSDVLVQIGTGKRNHVGSHSNPTTLTDVHVLVPNPGKATTTAIINQDHVLVDGSWMKRADSGWTTSLADHGIVVNGDGVTLQGMWVEHYQKTQILWNGERGRIIFLQNEPPYDPPSQAAWSDGAKEGYPALKVSDKVKSFQLDGFATFARFTGGGNTCLCYVSSAIETPVSKHVTFNGVFASVINFPNSNGGYRHVINNVGPAVDAAPFYGTSAYPQSDVHALTVTARIKSFPERR